MKCLQCGSVMKTRRENYRYGQSGLPVTLVDIEVSRCKKCGEYEVAIPRVEQLHRVIALAVIEKRARLTPEEITFLRKAMALSGTEFARRMGVSPGSVSRWENGREKMGPVADRLLRLMVAHNPPDASFSVDSLANIAAEEAESLHLDVRSSGKGWSAQAA